MIWVDKAPGQTLNVFCESGCYHDNNLWGTLTYSDDSNICIAGLHAGMIKKSGGSF